MQQRLVDLLDKIGNEEVTSEWKFVDLIPVNKIEISINFIQILGGRRGRDPMIVGFTTTNAISVYHH
jgi:hypothetical protein